MKNPPWIITVDELRAELKATPAPKLLDVRYQEEYEQSRIEGCTLIPLDELESRLGELSKSDDIVVYCAHGMRSLHAVMLMKQQGFEKVRSLEGGIVAWEESG